MNPITVIGSSLLFFYCLTQLLKFYGVSEEAYGVYILFYAVLISFILLLPRDFVKF